MSDSKELELREKELALKEKELGLFKEKELALKEKELGLRENGSKGSPKLKRTFIVLLILLLLAAVGLLGADKLGFLDTDKLKQLAFWETDNSKELELKEKELALREKELALKKKSSDPDPKKSGKTSPPFEGTIFIDKEIITSSDPTVFTDVVYSDLSMRNMFDRRVDSWIDVRAYIFSAQYNDGSTIEVRVNEEFGSIAAAEKDARFYAEKIGQLPAVLRQDIKTITIHKGKELFGGGNDDILIHTGQTAEYTKDGILEETLVHEACHTSLDARHSTSSGWIASQAADGNFISKYARDNSKREDIAESFLLFLAVKYKSDKISQKLLDTINNTIPNRIKYFNSQKFDMDPVK